MTNKKSKVLIIKVGHSETLDPEISDVTSYGDVIRTTVLLHLYKNDHVTWLVDEKAYPILKNNTFIDNILIYNLTSVLELQSESFDTVINLEKVPGICAMADSIRAWRRYGFRFDERSSQAEAYDGSHVVMDICRDIEKKRKRKACWQEGLFEMVDAEWKSEEYILGYKPASEEKYDIGFNYEVGNKWHSKAWPMEYWKKLEKIIGNKYKISWQQGLKNMEEYFDWINSCRLIVTSDSFGLHLGLVMKKYVIAMFGPTNSSEAYLYNRGKIITPKDVQCDDFPCCLCKCKINEPCMNHISPEDVFKEIDAAFQKGLCNT